jgi:hypothetical protein
MRLKEDNNSWKSRSITRRDYRHDPGLPEDEVPQHKKKKPKINRSRCKHEMEVLPKSIGAVYFTVRRCKLCNKRTWQFKGRMI